MTFDGFVRLTFVFTFAFAATPSSSYHYNCYSQLIQLLAATIFTMQCLPAFDPIVIPQFRNMSFENDKNFLFSWNLTQCERFLFF